MSHYDTIFHQFNQLIPRGKFKEIVDRFHGDYKVRSFHCWAQLVALLYGQLTGQHSLFAPSPDRLFRMPMVCAPLRSTRHFSTTFMGYVRVENISGSRFP